MTFPEKLEKLLNHWIKHNREHVGTYRSWADKAVQEGMMDIAREIEQAAEIAERTDVALQNTLERLKRKG